MIEIFGTSNCVYCKQAVSLCENNGLNYTYVSLDKEKLALLQERIGNAVRTVPQIFIDNKYIPGGFNGLKEVLNSR